MALLFKIPLPQIKETLDVTNDQIYYTKHHRLTPQKTKAGRHAKLHTPEKTQLKEWLDYCRRVSRKKGFSDDPKVCQERLDLAEDGSIWPRSRVQQVCFTDEV